MDIYIKSSGVSSDYYWQKIEKASIIKKEPEIPQKILSLIDSDYPSLVLFRHNSQLLLLVTALDTEKRTDNRMRKIRNSIVWIGDNNTETEKILRSLVIKYCKNIDSLALPMDEAVANAKDGFSVDYSKLPSLELEKNLGSSSPDLTLNIGDLDNLRQGLAKKLQETTIPLQKEGFLIVLSEVNSRKSFQEAQVWRGLSKQIQSDEWEVIEEDTSFFRKQSKSKSNLGKNSMATTVTEEKNFSSNIFTMVLGVCLIVSVIGNIWQWNQTDDIKNKQRQSDNLTSEIEDKQRQSDSLTSEIKDKKEQSDNLASEIKKEQDDLAFYNQKKQSLKEYFQNFKGDFEKFQNNVYQVFKDVNARTSSEAKSRS